MKIVKKNKTYFININDINEQQVVDQLLDTKLDIKKISEDVFSIIKTKQSTVNTGHTKPTVTPKPLDSKQKIFNLLNDVNLTAKDKVEGAFEKFLKSEDLKVFKELLRSKYIYIFKLSDKYKKGIYKVSDSAQKENNTFDDFDKNSCVIITNQNDASTFSQKHNDQIKANKIIGLKSFDGNYYVIDFLLFKQTKDKIFSLKLENTFSIKDIQDKLNLSEDVIKITLELIKEDGLVIEKRKEIYQLV